LRFIILISKEFKKDFKWKMTGAKALNTFSLPIGGSDLVR
jgi:hypothetical protein